MKCPKCNTEMEVMDNETETYCIYASYYWCVKCDEEYVMSGKKLISLKKWLDEKHKQELKKRQQELKESIAKSWNQLRSGIEWWDYFSEQGYLDDVTYPIKDLIVTELHCDKLQKENEELRERIVKLTEAIEDLKKI